MSKNGSVSKPLSIVLALCVSSRTLCIWLGLIWSLKVHEPRVEFSHPLSMRNVLYPTWNEHTPPRLSLSELNVPMRVTLIQYPRITQSMLSVCWTSLLLLVYTQPHTSSSWLIPLLPFVSQTLHWSKARWNYRQSTDVGHHYKRLELQGVHFKSPGL